MKKQSRKSTTVTEMTSRRRAVRQADSPRTAADVLETSERTEAVVVPISRRVDLSSAPIAASPDLAACRKDRAAEFLAELGLGDREIASIRESVPVVPFDAELVGRCRAFVTANLQGWDHATWLAFVEDLASEGYAIGAESGRWWLAQKFVGSLLEAIRAAEMAAIAGASSPVAEAKAA